MTVKKNYAKKRNLNATTKPTPKKAESMIDCGGNGNNGQKQNKAEN